VDFKTGESPLLRNQIYERALKELPGSYKIWHAYLTERVIQVRTLPIIDPAYDAVNNTFERCLVYLGKVVSSRFQSKLLTQLY
jgi:pre-mRNA-splicing factor SYF1